MSNWNLSSIVEEKKKEKKNNSLNFPNVCITSRIPKASRNMAGPSALGL